MEGEPYFSCFFLLEFVLFKSLLVQPVKPLYMVYQTAKPLYMVSKAHFPQTSIQV